MTKLTQKLTCSTHTFDEIRFLLTWKLVRSVNRSWNHDVYLSLGRNIHPGINARGKCPNAMIKSRSLDGSIYYTKPASISIDDANRIVRHFVRMSVNSEFILKCNF